MKTYPIRKLNNLNYPRFMIFFDTETNQSKRDEISEQHSFRLGVAIYVELDKDYKIIHEESYHFYRIGDFWRYVYTKAKIDRVLYIFAHNIKYDLMSVQFEKGITAIGFDATFPILGNNFIMSAFSGKRKIKFLDSFNYFKVKLRTMGKAVGQPKIKLKNKALIHVLSHYRNPPLKLLKFSERNIHFNAIDDKTLATYCQNDVEIVKKIILRYIDFLREDKRGSLEPTAAGVAFNVFRTRFNDETIHYHMNAELLKHERSAYKGGRVECFYIGKKRQKFYLFDVNSMYPYVMANCQLPVKPILQAENLSFKEALKYAETHYLIAECTLSYKSHIGLYGTHYDQKLLFPIGNFKTTLHNPEIIQGLQSGHILSIGKTIIYEKAYALKAYAEYFYNIRLQTTDSTFNLLSKLMLNSLYGRFGMSHYERDIIDWPSENPIGIVMIKEEQNGRTVYKPYYQWYGKAYYTDKDELRPKKNTNIALAGAVTAYARMKLLDYILAAGQGNSYYCDTDSVLVNENGAGYLSAFIDKKELGKLKQEMTCDFIQINAPKDYQFGAKRRMKGIPSVFTEQDGSYTFTRFTTLREYLRNEGDFFGTKVQTKLLTYNYDKGIILEDGFTKPLELAEV